MESRRNEWLKLMGSVGAACVLSGYVRYSLKGQWLLASKALVIGGAVLALVALVLGFRAVIDFFTKRSSQVGTNTFVLAAGVLAILGLLNFVGYRHHKRFDLTSEKLYTLSDQTRKIVSGLTQDVSVVRFAKQPDAQLADLMAEYMNLSSHVKYQNVDPQEKPEVAKEYGARRMGDIIVAYGQRKETLETTAAGELSEPDITSMIVRLTREKV